MIRKQLFYNNLKSYLPAFIGLVLFFAWSIPGNLSDADDAYTFSRLVRDESFTSLILPRYPLFLPLSKLGFAGARIFLPELQSHTYLTWQSLILGAWVVILVYHFCYRCVGLARNTSLATALLLLFSWAFWRYSVEAEVYIPSMFLLLVYMISLKGVNVQGSWKHWILPGLTGLAALLFYKPNALPVLLSLPFLLDSGRSWKKSVSASGLLFMCWLFLLFLLSYISPVYSFTGFLFDGANNTPGSIFSSVLVVLNNLVSFLWIFTFTGTRPWAEAIWPNKVLTEEFFLQDSVHVSAGLIAAAILLLAMLLFYNLIRNRKIFLTYTRQNWWRVMAFWLLTYAAMLIYFDPSSSEPWIMIQLPLILAAGPALFVFSGDRIARISTWMILVLTFLINLTGGMLLIRDKAYDYIYLRGRHLAGQVSENDIIMTFGPKPMEEYLSYHFPARVINLEENYKTGMEIIKTGNERGRIFLLDDVFHPEKAISFRMKEDVTLPGRLIRERYSLDTLYRENQFSIYAVRKQ